MLRPPHLSRSLLWFTLTIGSIVTGSAFAPLGAAPFQRGLQLELDVSQFGAVGDGSADDTAAIQAAIDAAISTSPSCPYPVGHTVRLPKGTFRITTTLVVKNVEGLRIVGAGPMSTRLVWRPEPNAAGPGQSSTLLALRDARHCSIEQLGVGVESALALRTAFALQNVPGGLVPPAQNHLSDIIIDGGATGVGRGVSVNFEQVLDEHNDGHVFERVVVRNYLDAAFSLEQRSARSIQFRDCRFFGAGRGLSGLATNRGACEDSSGSNCAGAFSWIGGGGGGNVAADFELGDVVDTIRIASATFEGSSRFLHTGGPSGNQWPMVIESVTWFDDGMGTHPNSPWPAAESMRIAFFQFRGPLVMTGNVFGSPPDPVEGPQIAKPAEIIWNPGNNFGQFVFEGNYIATSKDNPFSGFTASGSSTGIYPTIQQGNLVESEDYGSNAKLLPLAQHVTSLSGSATPTVGWLGTSRELFTFAGGAAIVDLQHGQVGQRLLLAARGPRTIVAGTNIRLAGSVNYDMDDGDSLTLVCFEPGIWTEVARSDS